MKPLLHRTIQAAAVLAAAASLASAASAFTPLAMHITGNQILDSNNNLVMLRGVDVEDPLANYRWFGHFTDSYYAEAALWGATVVRQPVHPSEWHDPDYLPGGRIAGQQIPTLVNAVTYAANHGMYSYIDWHSIGWPPTGYYESSNYSTTQAEMESFWTQVATQFKNDNRVAFYEIFNEPDDGTSPPITQADWDSIRAWYEHMIDVIRAVDPNKPVMCGGIHWSGDLEFANGDPIQRPGVIYTDHPYPNAPFPWAAKWGFMAATYPMFITEFGFDNSKKNGQFNESQWNAKGGVGTYHLQLNTYLENNHIGWTPWLYTAGTSLNFFTDWTYATPTEQGAYYESKMLNPGP
jgi:hypothetical protein